MPRTPGTLLLALALVAVPSVALAADAERVSEISDPRIEESSGLAVSQEHQDLAYTINDGDDAVVYAIAISTGEVVGTTRVRGGSMDDTESIAIDGDGTMWLADLGDNDAERGDAALYAFAEPGPGDHTVNAKRYPISYDGGPADIETFMVHPTTGEKFVATRNEKGPGTLYALPKKLVRDGDNRATHLDKPTPLDTSDGTFTTDGSRALIRTGEAVHVFDPETWTEVERLSVPAVKNGESIAVEPGGQSFLIGSEGDNSPLIRVFYGAGAEPEATPTPTPTPTADADDVAAEESDGVTVPVWVVVAGGVAVIVVAAAAVIWAARRRNA